MASADAVVLRVAIPATLVVGAIGTISGAFYAGAQGVYGGLIGTAIVVIFFTAGQGILGRVLRNNPQIAMSVALLVYLTKVGVLFLLLVLLQGVTWFNTQVFAATIVACTLAWTFAEVWMFSRTKMLVVDPQPSKPPTNGGAQ
jgi:ATP synthase protein I